MYSSFSSGESSSKPGGGSVGCAILKVYRSAAAQALEQLRQRVAEARNHLAAVKRVVLAESDRRCASAVDRHRAAARVDHPDLARARGEVLSHLHLDGAQSVVGRDH